MLILTIAKYFDELLQDRGMATIAALGVLCRIMVVTKDSSVMLVVTILRAKHSRAH